MLFITVNSISNNQSYAICNIYDSKKKVSLKSGLSHFIVLHN